MHSGLKQARQDEALASTARAVQDTVPRLDRIEAKLDQVLAMLKAFQPQQQRGGR